MFSIFRRKPPLVTDLSWIGTDIHSHLLPGLDDGSPDIETSLKLIRRLGELGFQKLYTTPHIFQELYPNTRQTIDAALNQLQIALQAAQIGVTLGAAAEYMLDADFVIDAQLLCLPNRHVLIEMSYLAEFPQVEQVVFDLQLQGYNVILAHPERYNFYHQNFDKYHRLKDRGCLFQLNLLSVTGYYGKPVKDIAMKLLKNGLYDLVGTDLHHEKHLSVLERAVKSGALYQEIGDYTFLNQELFP